MRSRRFLCAIGLILWVAMAHAGQPATSGPLSGELRARLQNEKLAIVSSLRGLPLGVRYKLQELFGSTTLDIAEPEAEFRLTDTDARRALPPRRLVAAGCTNQSYCLIYYERGGPTHTWQVALFHWTPDATRLEWGSTAPGGLKTIDDVRQAILSGAIAGGPPESW